MRFVFLICMFTYSLAAQDMGTINGEARHFRLTLKDDEIDFIKLDTATTTTKPVLLFCQGSLPLPLFIQAPDNKVFMIGGGITNFNYKQIQSQYHLIVISMPKTPLVVPFSHINQSYCYVPDSTNQQGFAPAYIAADYLDNYVQRANKVIQYLRKQKWVDQKKFIIAGHSQGAKIATKVALVNRHITHIGLFGANPFGRADQSIRSYRKQAESGQITEQEADNMIQGEYQYFKDVHQIDSLNKHPEYAAPKTFSEPFIDDWLKLKIPIYLAYGTRDIAADLCDLVPLFFIRENKNNLTQKRYLGLEHNFFEIGENGRGNYDKPYWEEVMNDFLEWILR